MQSPSVYQLVTQGPVCHAAGSQRSDCADKAAAPLPQGLPPEHRSGEEDRKDHGGGEGEETRPLRSGHWVSETVVCG